MIPRIYAYLAGLLAIIAVVGVIYGKGRLDARHSAELAAVQSELSTAKGVIQAERAARLQDAILAAEAAKRQAALTTKIDELNDYVDTLQDRDSQCLTGADTERLRDLWQ